MTESGLIDSEEASTEVRLRPPQRTRRRSLAIWVSSLGVFAAALAWIATTDGLTFEAGKRGVWLWMGQRQTQSSWTSAPERPPLPDGLRLFEMGALSGAYPESWTLNVDYTIAPRVPDPPRTRPEELSNIKVTLSPEKDFPMVAISPCISQKSKLRYSFPPSVTQPQVATSLNSGIAWARNVELLGDTYPIYRLGGPSGIGLLYVTFGDDCQASVTMLDLDIDNEDELFFMRFVEQIRITPP